MTKCAKEEWNGKCCCTCRHQRKIVKHPGNKGEGQGRITERMGYGCAYPELEVIVFSDSQHGLCEMHETTMAATDENPFIDMHIALHGYPPSFSQLNAWAAMSDIERRGVLDTMSILLGR